MFCFFLVQKEYFREKFHFDIGNSSGNFTSLFSSRMNAVAELVVPCSIQVGYCSCCIFLTIVHLIDQLVKSIYFNCQLFLCSEKDI